MPATVMVVVIVAIVMGGTLAIVSKAMQSKIAKMTGGNLEPQILQKLNELEQNNAELIRRIEVLESIVTDSGFDVDREIRKLG